MTPLRQRMLDAMSVRGFRPSTQQCYADAIYGLAKHYRGDPAQYSAQEIDAYLLHLVQERHLSYSSMNQAASAARFLYEKVLGHERAVFHIPMAKAPAKQPELLAREEIAHLFAACWRPTHRMLLQTVYATGLRVSEACAFARGRHRQPQRPPVHPGGLRQGRQRPLHPAQCDLARPFAQLLADLPAQVMAVLQRQRRTGPGHRVGPARLCGRPPACGHHQERGHPHPAPLLCNASSGRRG